MLVKQLVLNISDEGKPRHKIIYQLQVDLQASFKCAYPRSFPLYTIPSEVEKVDVTVIVESSEI